MNRTVILIIWGLIMVAYCGFYVWMAKIDFDKRDKE